MSRYEKLGLGTTYLMRSRRDLVACFTVSSDTMTVDYLKITMTSAKLEENEWKVNVEFVPKSEPMSMPVSASFSTDAFTGEVKQSKRGYTWRF